MADKLNIQFRIQAIDNFSKTMAKLESDLRGIQHGTDNLRTSVDVDVRMDDDQFQKSSDSIQRLKKKLQEKLEITAKLNGTVKFTNDLEKIEKKLPKDKIAVKVELNTTAFMASVKKVNAAKKSMAGDIKVDLDIKGYAMFVKQMDTVKRKIPKDKTIKYNLLAKDKFTKMFDKLDRRILGSKLLLQELNNTKVDINVESELPELMKDMKGVIKEAKKTSKQKVEVDVEVNGIRSAISEFRGTMAKFANISRNVGEIMSHYLVGNLVTLIPTLIPVIASVGGALGSLLPIIGTVGGAAAGLGTSFGLAGIGGAMAASLMVSALGEVFDVSKEQVKLNKKLAQTTDVKERKKIMEELAGLQGGLNKKQVEALDSLNKMKGVWGDISASLAPQSIGVFITLMDTLSQSLTELEPTFKSVIGHAQNLADFLNMQIDSADMQAFFDFLETTAGPTFETIGKAAINFGIGLLNMMEAFGPLSTLMSDGFLKMSEGFREWAANLSESDKFQSFMDYVAENLPKLGTIFEGFITGVTGMGEAFAPFTEDMLTGLADMMTKFGEWGQALSENEGFKAFITYVKENGPQVLDFFGELGTFITNLGIAFSGVGSFMLDFSTLLMEIGNTLMENHPEIAKFVAWILFLGAAILTHLPSFFLLKGAIKVLGPIISTVIGFVAKLIPKMGGIGGVIMRILPWVVRMGTMLLGVATGPIGLLIGAAVALAIAIATNWDAIWAKTKEIWNAFIDFIKGALIDALAACSKMAVDIVNVFDGIDLYDSGVKIIKSVIGGITSMIGAVGRAAGGIAKKISGFFPHSPAKEGALSNLDHLDFKGPVVKSLNRDASGINRAMSKMLVAPELNAEGYGAARSSYSARSAGYTKQQSAQEMAAAYANIVIQSSDVVMSGEKVGQMTWKSTTRNAERDKRQREIFEGRGRI